MRGDVAWRALGVESSPLVVVDDADAERQRGGAEFGTTSGRCVARCADFDAFGGLLAVSSHPPGTVKLFREAQTNGWMVTHEPLVDGNGDPLLVHANDSLSDEHTEQSPRVVSLELAKSHDASFVLFVLTETLLRAFRICPSTTHNAVVITQHVGDQQLTELSAKQHEHGRVVGLSVGSSGRSVAVAWKNAVTLCSFNSFADSFRHSTFKTAALDGPVVSSAVLDSDLGKRVGEISDDENETIVAIGLRKEILLVKFVLDGTDPGSVTRDKNNVTVVRRILIDAPGPVRSVSTHGAVFFVTTERNTALPSFGASERQPVNFAFAESGLRNISISESELTESIQDGSAAAIPFLRANVGYMEAQHRKDDTLRSLVTHFLSPELRVETSQREDVRAARVCATVQAFAFDAQGVLSCTSLDLSPSITQPEIVVPDVRPDPDVALNTRLNTHTLRLGIVDVGPASAASVAVVELHLNELLFTKIGNAPLSGETKNPHGTGDTDTITHVECAVGVQGRVDTGEESQSMFITVLVSDKEIKTTTSIFGGGFAKKSKPSLASFRLSVSEVRGFSQENVETFAGIGTGRMASQSGNTKPPPLSNEALARLAGVGAVPGTEKLDSTLKTLNTSPNSAPQKPNDFDRLIGLIQSLDRSMHERLDRIEASLQRHERRLKKVEANNLVEGG